VPLGQARCRSESAIRILQLTDLAPTVNLRAHVAGDVAPGFSGAPATRPRPRPPQFLLTFTLMVLGFDSSRFGMVRINCPSLYSATTLSESIELGSEKLREKAP
jgi:hypothetical protein